MLKKYSCILLLLLVGMFFLTGCPPAENEQDVADQPADGGANLEASLAADAVVAKLTASDGQPLLPQLVTKDVPQRPDDPSSLPETDPLHWYDLEYSGWGVEKVNIPVSPADGAKGKDVVLIVHGDHPWTTAYIRGATKVAEAYGMNLSVMSPNWSVDAQTTMVDQAIVKQPDMIIMIPVDAEIAVKLFRRINEANIPVIASNTHPASEAMQHVIAWTGPDDWGQFRMLSRVFADKLNKEGGYAIIQHHPGGSPFFARTFGAVTELAQIAPNMELLDKQAPGFEAEATMHVVSDWITRFGDRLNGIVLSDDSAQTIGAIEAIERAGRTDIVVVAAGNSKVGMDLVAEGRLHAITYQTAEGDGAVAVKAAADWFNGKTVEPVRYLPKHIITIDDVAEFKPAQW